MINNRQPGRRRGRNNQRPNGGGGNRSNGGDNGNRIDSRARGNAVQLLEKYRNLARDAQLSGDRVNAEYYLQFADHYFRVLADNRARQEEQQSRHRRFDENQSDEDEDDGDAGMDDGGDIHNFDRFDREERAPRQDRDDRAPRQDRDDRIQRQDRDDRPPRQERNDRGDRPQRTDRPDRNRGERQDFNRSQNGERSEPRQPTGRDADYGQQRDVRSEQTIADVPADADTAPRGRGRPRKPRTGENETIRRDEDSVAGFDPAILPPAIGRVADDGADVVEADAAKPVRRTRRVRPTTEAAE